MSDCQMRWRGLAVVYRIKLESRSCSFRFGLQANSLSVFVNIERFRIKFFSYQKVGSNLVSWKCVGVSRELSQRQNTAARYCGKLNRIFLAARLKGPSRVVVSRKEAVPSSSLSV